MAPDVVAGFGVSKYLALTLIDVARSVKVVQARISNAERATQWRDRSQDVVRGWCLVAFSVQENYVQYGLNINKTRVLQASRQPQEEGERCENWGESSGGEKE